MNMHVVRLKDLCSLITKGTTPTSIGFDFADTGIGFLRVQNVSGGSVNFQRETLFINEKVHQELRRSQIKRGDILLSIAGTIGRTGIVPADAPPLNCNQALAILRTQDKVFRPYLRHWLESAEAQSQMRGATVTGTIQNLSLAQVGGLQVPLPPLPEQRRIAAILDQADALRAKRRETLARLDILEDALFLEFQHATRTESHEILLSGLSERTRGSFVNGPFGSDLLTSELQDDGVPVVYIRDIRNGQYQRVSTSCVSDSKARDLAVCAVKPGDVLVAKVGDPPGIAAVYPEGEPAAVVTQDVIRLRPNLDVAMPEFIKAYLNSPIGRWKIAGITVQATRARVSLGDFKKLTIEVPPIPLQVQFVEFVGGVKRLKRLQEAALAELDSLFSSLQHRAFRGEL